MPILANTGGARTGKLRKPEQARQPVVFPPQANPRFKCSSSRVKSGPLSDPRPTTLEALASHLACALLHHTYSSLRVVGLFYIYHRAPCAVLCCAVLCCVPCLHIAHTATVLQDDETWPMADELLHTGKVADCRSPPPGMRRYPICIGGYP